jgi:integrase
MSRRGNGEGTGPYRYRTGAIAWAAQVTVVTPDGKRKRVTVYGATRQECLAKKREKEMQCRRGVTPTARPPKLADYGREWLNETLRHRVTMGTLQETTRASYRDQWERHIVPALGHLRWDELTPRVLRGWLTGLATRPSRRTGKPLKPRSQELAYATLRLAANDAVIEGYITDNPLRLVPGPRAGESEAMALTPGDAQKFFVAALEHPLMGLWVLLMGTGLRIGEALALQWADVNFDEATLTVRRAVARVQLDFDPALGRHPTKLIIKNPKTPRSRARVALPRVVVAALRQHRKHQAETKLRSRHWQDSDLVFTTPIGTLLDHRNVLREVKALAKAAGITEQVHTHELRHTAASLMYAAGADLRAIQAALRHTRLSTTADVYVRVFDEVQRDAADALNTTLERFAGAATEPA